MWDFWSTKWNWGSFLRVLRFPLPILNPPTASHSSSIVRVWYNRPVSGRRTKWTQSHLTPTKNKSKGNVLFCQGHRVPQRTVTDERGAMVE
jgi:hypothetical protein